KLLKYLRYLFIIITVYGYKIKTIFIIQKKVRAMDLQLPLYFYHHEINATPDVIFEVINDDKEILNRVTKLSGFTYKNGGENHREEGTEGSLQYDNSAYKTKITHYSDERRLEFKTDLPS